ncbi:MAG: OmpA family protein, partial [Bacteroidales bacterium]|nr:OmpA family protein [Bacteroidales bacterium]
INLRKKINREANRRANEKANEGVKKGFDILEKGIEEAVIGKDSTAVEEGQAGEAGTVQGQAAGGKQTAGAQSPANTEEALKLNWSKYDFVPGDKIIFEDNLIGEENGEFPSRWDLVQGTTENAEFGGENIIMFRGGSPIIVPYLKNPGTDYLPEVFTVEFDFYVNNHNGIQVYFYDRKNQRSPSGSSTLDITHEKMGLGSASSSLPGKGSTENQWAHISIAYTNGKMKAYIDETRLINIPHLAFDPTGISIHVYHASDQNQFFIKNFRLAEGGVKYYDRFLQDGKIVSNGIRFDVGKATLRPESMGVLNEIYKMLSEHPEVNVSIEGHTDSDGDNNMNQKLSEDRAKTVMNQLISMGLPADRLTSKGFGESEPINTNATPEGKAENRRVEFVRTN